MCNRNSFVFREGKYFSDITAEAIKGLLVFVNIILMIEIYGYYLVNIIKDIELLYF